MNFELCRAAVEGAFQTKWAEGGELFPIEYEGNPLKSPPTVWGRLTVLPGDSIPLAIGLTSTRTAYVLVLQVFIPEKGGTTPATKAADKLAAALNLRTLKFSNSVVTFDTVGMQDVGLRAATRQKNIRLPFRLDTYQTS